MHSPNFFVSLLFRAFPGNNYILVFFSSIIYTPGIIIVRHCHIILLQPFIHWQMWRYLVLAAWFLQQALIYTDLNFGPINPHPVPQWNPWHIMAGIYRGFLCFRRPRSAELRWGARHIQSKLKEAFTPPLRSSPYTRSVGAQKTGKNYALLQSCNDFSKRVQLNIESMAVNMV